MSQIIDIALWDRAVWSGMILGSQSGPPLMALGFLDASAGRDIFANWRARLGGHDPDGQIRVAIVEGDIPGQEPGWSVTVGPNVRQAAEPDPDFFVRRVYRMKPVPQNSPWLREFKKSYLEHGRYLFTWAEFQHERYHGAFKVHVEDSIEKTGLLLRSVSGVTLNDPDGAILLHSRTDKAN